MNGQRKRKIMIGVAVLAVLVGGILAIVTASGSGKGRFSQRGRTAAVSERARVGGDIALAASYLGLAPAQLRQRLRAGSTLADVASATGGKSTSGLIDALFAANAARLAAEVSAGKLSTTRQASRLAHLRKRVTAAVYRPRGRALVSTRARGAAAEVERVPSRER
jgi:hypothetical protein